jgi:phosphopantothenoylcysteine decarboxylase/phosphopantothenate--cysteine ligase
MIVANDISRTDGGFDSDANAVTIISANGELSIPLAPKSEIAAAILDHTQHMLAPAEGVRP